MQKKKTARGGAKTAAKRKPPLKKGEGQEKFSLKRLIPGGEKPDLSGLEAGSTTILDILSPTAIDTKSRDCILVDGVYHAYLYVAGYGYSTTVGSCWLAPLVEAGEGVSLSFTVKRQSKDKILSKISQTTMMNRSRMRDVGDTRQDYEELDSAINSGLYLKDAMNRQNEDFYYMHTLVEVTADGTEYRPWDFSVTKNAFALMICAVVLCALLFPLVRWYRRKPLTAPRRLRGMLEAVVEMLYRDVLVPMLGKDARRYAPYLLTLFFFILVANLMGLMVVFPGGANLTGNLSVTLVLALCTFVVVNFSGNRRYWKEVFWPDVPTWLKVPVPMMPVIEVFGILTKPVALMIRLFANMLGGHLITLVLVSLIFIMSAWGVAVAGGTAAVAVLFAVFMGLIDLLICFIQAYVFFMLSTIFISQLKQ